VSFHPQGSQTPLTAVKGILVICPRMIRNLDAGAPLVRILKQINVGALVKTVVRRQIGRRAVEIVDVAVSSEVVSDGPCHRRAVQSPDHTHSVATCSSPGWAAIVMLQLRDGRGKEASEGLEAAQDAERKEKETLGFSFP
jgi:hypothetical protein